MRRMSWERMDPELMSFDNPLLRWHAAHHARGQSRALARADGQGLDLVAGPLASAAFSVGLDDDGAVLLGMEKANLRVLSSVRWNDAALLRRVRGGDWVVLRTDDARTDEPLSEEPLPMRLWLPAQSGLIDMFAEAGAVAMRLAEVDLRHGKALLRDGARQPPIPLLLKGRWDGAAGGGDSPPSPAPPLAADQAMSIAAL